LFTCCPNTWGCLGCFFRQVLLWWSVRGDRERQDGAGLGGIVWGEGGCCFSRERGVQLNLSLGAPTVALLLHSANSTAVHPSLQYNLTPFRNPIQSNPIQKVPQFILEEAILAGSGPSTSVVVTQPRRIAATSVAERVAAERGEAAPGAPGARGRGRRGRARAFVCVSVWAAAGRGVQERGRCGTKIPNSNYYRTPPTPPQKAPSWATRCAWTPPPPATRASSSAPRASCCGGGGGGSVGGGGVLDGGRGVWCGGGGCGTTRRAEGRVEGRGERGGAGAGTP
jgi:hypothetical protein